MANVFYLIICLFMKDYSKDTWVSEHQLKLAEYLGESGKKIQKKSDFDIYFLF